MKLEFEFETNDWMALQKHHLNNSKRFQRSKLIMTLIVPVIYIFFIVIGLINGGQNPIMYVVLSSIAILWFIFYPKRLIKRTLKRTLSILDEGNNSNIFGSHNIEIDSKGIFYKNAQSESHTSWKEIVKIEQTESHYFLYNTSLTAIIIPKAKVGKDLVELEKVLESWVAGKP